MSCKVAKLWALLLCSLASARATHADDVHELRPTDFAYGREVQPSDDASPLIQLALPVDVYQASRTPGLQDVWVFNARGAPVPHALRRAAQAPPPAATAELVPIFPVRAEHGAAPVELSVAISRAPSGEVLQLQSRQAAPPAADGGGGTIGAYLLDVRAVPRGVHALRFSWVEAPAQLVLPLAVDASSDLIEWRPLAVEGGLLHLEHAGNRIERDRIELGASKSAFLRVRPADRATFPAQLASVFAEPAAEVAQRVLERVVVRAEAPAAQSGVYRFDLGGPIPIERLELELPEDNSVIAAELWAADKRDGPYQRIAEARFYRVLAQGKPLSGPTLSIFRQRARYYELRVDPTRLGLGEGRPSLIAYYAPDELLFLRRGAGPFTLAYGRHSVARQRFEADDLLSLAPLGSKPARASLGERKSLGSKSVLEAPKPPPPYTTYALWAVLIAGVGVLGALAYRLIKS